MPLTRLLLPDDETHYSLLWRNALVEQAQFFRVAPQDFPEPYIPTHFADDSFTIEAFEERKLVGTVSIEREFQLKLRHKALVFRMFVHPAVAGRGIGRLLMNEAIHQAKKVSGLRQLHLTVLATNGRAIRLYQSVGFNEFAREPESVKIDQSYVDELQMQYPLIQPTPELKT